MLLSACATSNLESYVDPSYSSRSISKIAVMPITNQRINAGQAIQLNRAFIQELQRRNPNLKIVGGQEAVAKINEAKLANTWANFLTGYATSGLPNTNYLRDIAAVLGVDGIIAGSVLNVVQKDSDGRSYPVTQVSIRYAMFAGRDGALLWELTGEGKYQPYGYTAVPVFEAAKLAHDKILKDMPI